MTTNEAFKHLTSQRGWYKQAGIPANSAATIKADFKKGKRLSEEKKIALLQTAGYQVVQQMDWAL